MAPHWGANIATKSNRSVWRTVLHPASGQMDHIMTNQTHRPEFLSVPEACALVGIGRTKLYALLSEGLVTARKAGTRTLVETSSLTAWTASLPMATFSPLPTRKRAA